MIIYDMYNEIITMRVSNIKEHKFFDSEIISISIVDELLTINLEK